VNLRTLTHRPRSPLVTLVTAAALVLAWLFAAGGGTAQAATSLPCDIYASYSTPCAAAHSTTRALFAAYNGPLYQVTRASDGTGEDIDTLSAGGYADAAAQNSFCLNTLCRITEIFDQSGHGNNLTVEGAGGNGGADVGAVANALPITIDGNAVYGVYVTAGVGYRDDATTDVPTGSTAQDEYMVTSADHVNGSCCFDYGNAEANNDDNGNGHMESINFGTECWFSPCTGSGPWVQADLENGLFSGGNGSNTANDGNSSAFVTALVKSNNTTTYEIKGGNAQSGALSTWYSGALPDISGYTPMHLEGAIVLGTGGDDSNSSVGDFFEGVVTNGEPSDAADTAVQANIVAADYAFPSTSTGEINAVGAGKCLDVPNSSDTAGTQLDSWTCNAGGNQEWTHTTQDQLTVYSGSSQMCLDGYGQGLTAGTKVDIYPCNQQTNQEWSFNANGTITEVQSGLCLDVSGASTANGAEVELWTCNGGSNQQWTLG
jgi:non-reducing end alpha-L-arabinofuranosidase